MTDWAQKIASWIGGNRSATACQRTWACVWRRGLAYRERAAGVPKKGPASNSISARRRPDEVWLLARGCPVVRSSAIQRGARARFATLSARRTLQAPV